MTTATDNWTAFKDWATSELERSGVKVVVGRGEVVRHEGGSALGYFDEKALVYAAKHRLAHETFLHEFCHFLQWRERKWVFRGSGSIYELATRKKLTCKDWGALWDTLALEHDCEARAIRLGRKWGIFDEATYTRGANVCLLTHHYFFLTSKWPTGGYDPELRELVPSTLISLKALRSIDMHLMEQFDDIICPK